MTTPIHERSGTANEDGDADLREDIQVCDICGDAGYEAELAVCSRCKDSAEHIYCMVTMHNRVPLQWLCKQCELEEEKGSFKKRSAGNEPFSTLAYKKQNTKELLSCSVLSEAKNILVQELPSKLISCESRSTFPSIPSANLTENIEPSSNFKWRKEITDEVVTSLNAGLEKKKEFCAVEAQVHGGSTMIKNPITSIEGKYAVKACLSTLKQGEAIALSSASLREPSGFLNSLSPNETNMKIAPETRTGQESSIKGKVDTSPRDASNHARFPSYGLLSGSKRVFSRSVSMKSDDDQPSFLLPSRPNNFTRSKSAVIRPSGCWTSDKEPPKGLPLAIHEHAKWGMSSMMDSTKATLAGPIKQAGQERVSDYGRDLNAPRHQSSRNLESPHYPSSRDLESPHHQSSRDLESPCHRYPRDSKPLQFGGSNDKDSRKCYRCGEVGHIAARCKNVSSSRQSEWEGSRGQASSEMNMAGRQLSSEGPLGLHSNKGGGSLKESLSWKSQRAADSSGTWSKPSSHTLQQIKEESLDITETENTNKEEERLSWKAYNSRFPGICTKLSSSTPQLIRISGKERLDSVDIMNTPVKLSQKPSDNALVAERQVAQVQGLDGERGSVAPSSFSEIGKRVSTQDITTVQSADAMIDKHLRGPQPNQVVLPHVQNKCDNYMSTRTPELDLAVSSPLDSFCKTHAEPCVEMLWSGCFNVSSNNCLVTYKGLQAHPSTKADPRVFEAIKTLPYELYLEELKRGLETDTWPRSLLEQPPSSSSVGVYFFPVDMECHDIWYKPLLDHLSANDLALKTNLDLFQLLIFPSQLLPQAEQCWEDRQYLWGILRRGTSFKISNAAAVG